MKKILIVDDDVKTTRPLVEHLEASFSILHLDSADNVLETIQGSQFDAVILDIMMPIPDSWTFDEKRRSDSGLSSGEVLYEKIREVHPDLPILIYSAKNPENIERDAKTSILRKPELYLEVVNRINKLIGHEN